MMIEDNPKVLTLKINEFSKSKLKNFDDIESLLNIGLEHRKEFDELIFTAKYAKGLMRILKETVSKPEFDFSGVKKDLSENINKITSLIKKLMAFSDDQNDAEIYIDKYCKMDADSFKNLNSLLSDLEWIKIYFNELKGNK